MLSSAQIGYLSGLVIVPVVLLIGSILLRRVYGRPLTVGTDWLLLIVTFDATAIVEKHRLAPMIRDQLLRSSATTVFLVLFIVSMIMWFIVLTRLEKKLEHAYNAKHLPSKLGWFGLSWSMVTILSAINILIFTLKTGA